MKDVKRLFKDDVTKKILMFFNENPQCIDTAKGISIWIGCDAPIVHKTLSGLVKMGILVNHKTAFTDAYAYTNNRDIAKKIEKRIRKIKNSQGKKK